MIRIEPVSETNAIIYLGDEIDLALTPQIGELTVFLTRLNPEAIVEVIPSYTSVLVQFRPQLMTHAELKQAIEGFKARLSMATNSTGSPVPKGKLIELPVYYDLETGPDLQLIADAKGISVTQVIETHSKQDYTVCAIGFAPGFAFLASVDEAIATPRHSTPRKRLPAGSVGIANSQTAVYPADSPGGWQIIGNCPLSLFNPDSTPMSPFNVGDTVRFLPISREKFIEQGGEIWPDWK
ncbi:allophanate hydrolase subunit 1 [Photobacterium sanctipauli]|uniref:Allophanate hydrolase subunit 1 n=1 Tax=Photobacterium sanctipauli TaxID=1342794 RepID=A0A2T3NNQ0_9GAMM|nr:5-oxoprolinase subunit PxpB [Photobacterium sanctipauli]PSW17612.1 allophanate hydrolase subunit 1 [Photobacterium sanctipauli]